MNTFLTSSRLFFFSFFLCCLFLSCAITVWAQTPSLGNTANLEIEPRYPQPGTTFTARLALYGDTVTSYTWFINGEQVDASADANEITLPAPSTLGDSIAIRVQANTQSGPVTISRTVTASAVDIVIEANTTAPYFYEGRHVPSSGAPVILTAVPHVFTEAGVRIAPSDLFYTWTVNNTILNQGKGVVQVTIPQQRLGQTTVRLAVASATGQILHEQTISTPRVEPAMLFYTLSPLKGLSRNAVQDAYLPVSEETTVRAEPYFVSQDIFANAQYSWSIDGTPVNNQSDDPRLITLRSNVKGGTSDIGFSIRNLNALSQYAAGLFRIVFNS